MNAYNVSMKEAGNIVSPVYAESATEAVERIAERTGIDGKSLVAIERPIIDSPIDKLFLMV